MTNNPYAFMANMFRSAFLVFYAVVALALFGYARMFIPAPFFGYPFGIVYFLAPGAVLAAWVFHASRGSLHFDWKWALLSIVLAFLLWEGVAKGVAWVVTEVTGTAYDQTFPLERSLARVMRKGFYSKDITDTNCLQRLQGEILNSTLPQYLCLKGTDYAKLGGGLQQIRLEGRIGWFGRSIEGYVLPAR